MDKQLEISPELIDIILDLSIKEFEQKNWGSTEQYLEVMEILYENNLPVVARIEKVSTNDIIIYFKIKDEKFYYTHYFSSQKSELELTGVDITAATDVYLKVYSENLSIEEMEAVVSFVPTRRYIKGMKDKFMPVHKMNRIDFEVDDNFSGNIERKLHLLLNELLPHKDELDLLKNQGCHIYITAYWEAYIGNNMLGGIYLDTELISKLNNLKLEIDFDISTSGESFN